MPPGDINWWDTQLEGCLQKFNEAYQHSFFTDKDGQK